MCEPKIKYKSIEKWIPDDQDNCLNCHRRSICKQLGLKDECDLPLNLGDKDLSKPGILLIDDNPGIVSFLEDDFEVLYKENKINLNKYNIFSFTSKMAAYMFMATVRKYGDLNIKYAIIDITLGGIVTTIDNIIKLTGVDVLEMLLEMNPDIKYIFYTGNQMNVYIKPIADIMEQYKKLTKKDINDIVLFKTSLSMRDRQQFILDELVKYKI